MEPAPMPCARLCCARLSPIPLDLALGVLSGAERERTRRFRLRDDRERFVKSRAVLRWVLADASGRPPQSFAFLEGEGRKPVLEDDPSGLHFNLAHSGDYALCGVADAPIGIDIEAMSADIGWEALAAAWFHPSERAVLRAVNSDRRLEAFYQTWVNKEAYIKLGGHSRLDDLAVFSTPLEGGRVADPSQGSLGTASIVPIPAPMGYKSALACDSRGLDFVWVSPKQLAPLSGINC